MPFNVPEKPCSLIGFGRTISHSPTVRSGNVIRSTTLVAQKQTTDDDDDDDDDDDVGAMGDIIS